MGDFVHVGNLKLEILLFVLPFVDEALYVVLPPYSLDILEHTQCI